MIAQTYVRFATPVTLNLRVAPLETSPTVTRTFERLPLHVQVDAVDRTLSAYLPPIPGRILLYGPSDFAAACGDSMEDHAARVLQILGSDPSATLQFMIAGIACNPSPRPVRTVSKLALRRALRVAGLESALDSYLDANPTARADWDDSQLLDVRDPLLSESLPEFATASGLSVEQIQQLFQSCQ